MGKINIEEINYKKFGSCIRLYNGQVELYVTIDRGPRIIRYGFIGGENEFCEDIPTKKKVFDDEWRLLGGHRLWHSPENNLRTYIPDNGPVKWSKIENGIKLEQSTEIWTQIKKTIEIKLNCSTSDVKITHRLTNKNAWPIELSVWALTVMAPGGVQVIPQISENKELLPNRTISLWSYSKMNDSRVKWGDKYIILSQDKNKNEAFKVGISNEQGWAAYFNHNNLFIKKFNHYFNKDYSDFGVSYETYTDRFMMEMETLSPITRLKVDEEVAHTEEWRLIKNMDFPGDCEYDIDKLVKLIKL